jgi:hypothetical protein
MKRILKLDAQGKQEVMEEIRRTNARRKEIEEESAKRTGRPLTGPVSRVMALPLSDEQAAAIEAGDEKGTPPL